MSTDRDQPPTHAEAALAAVEAELATRWGETRLDPSLVRMAALVRELGEPQRAYPSIHLTGTNGKTSTARMVEALLLAHGLRTGRYTSPHLRSVTERIGLDGAPVSPELFARTYERLRPHVLAVDAAQRHRLSFFEVLTGMAYAAFARARVDAAVVEVGMGGTWDATNVLDGTVSVVTPVSLDHTDRLGSTPGEIAEEKKGIIKPGGTTVLARQPADAERVLVRAARAHSAELACQDREFALVSRRPVPGGQSLELRGIGGAYPGVFLPLHGRHQAQNAAVALASAEAFLGVGTGGAGPLDPRLVRTAFASAASPGRLETVRENPTVVVDAAHNPAGALATAEAVAEVFPRGDVIGVVAVSAGKDARAMLEALEPALSLLVVTENTTERALPAAELASIAMAVFGPHRLRVHPHLPEALTTALRLAEEHTAGCLITGSIATAGEAKGVLGRG
ncbi:bifunctional folylpolyglutamate synthase/dihydrofolate synthase [Streptomyces sp. NPDC050560]|uniref:bifunctional folylpolyglutamate synthase/dihydrofolate synthase n=1 Tax=Streptomyces sp. NPDC050560 TaxID=3365630 RepID=UPI0037ABCF98